MPIPVAKRRTDTINYMINDSKSKDDIPSKFIIKDFIWKIECVVCKKEIYSLKKIRSDQTLKKHVTVFLDGDYKYVAPRNYNDCGIYDKFNVNWYCFNCK